MYEIHVLKPTGFWQIYRAMRNVDEPPKARAATQHLSNALPMQVFRLYNANTKATVAQFLNGQEVLEETP